MRPRLDNDKFLTAKDEENFTLVKFVTSLLSISEFSELSNFTDAENLVRALGEDTGLLITDKTNMEAIGSGLIILVDGTNMRTTNITDVEMGEPVSIENLIVHVMSIHDHFDLKTKKLIIDHFKPAPKIG